MKTILQLGGIFSIIIGLFWACDSPIETPQTNKEDKETEKKEGLIWSDEFEEDGAPNAAKWRYDYGDGCPNLCGWGNKELQFYTKRAKNARVENGNLIIEAHKEDYENRKYSSARLTSKSEEGWQYKRIEIRAKLPNGKGTWPAIWMLPDNQKYGHWPKSGEIDIMEHVGFAPDSVYGTVHTQAFNHKLGTEVGGHIVNKSVEHEFHVYGINWYEDRIVFFMDDKVYFTFEKHSDNADEWPFDHPFHLVMNIAVGGFWGGRKGIDDKVFPQRMEVDYVRVYEL